MVGFTGVLAHQGGWDEMLLVALPIVLFVILLRVANSRAARLHGVDDHLDQQDAGDVDEAGDGPAPDPTAAPAATSDGGPITGPDR